MRFLQALLMVFSTSPVWSLRLEKVLVPNVKIVGENAVLSCQYNLEQDSLYSVKWYKGGREFFRFVPRDDPPAQAFALEAVSVNISQSNRHQVVLMNVGLSSSGRYKCEVSADAPHFQTSSASGEMSVIAVPESGPEIEGLKSFYRPGETLQVNCTSRNSKPAAALAWYINNKKVDNENVIEYAPRVEEGGLETSILGLRLLLKSLNPENSISRNGTGNGVRGPPGGEWRKGLLLNCTAAIGSAYWTSTAALAKPEEILPSQKLMESRPAAAKSPSSAVSIVPAWVWLASLVPLWTLLGSQ